MNDTDLLFEWLDGATQADLAKRHGKSQTQVSYALRRVLRDEFGRPMHRHGVLRQHDIVRRYFSK